MKGWRLIGLMLAACVFLSCNVFAQDKNAPSAPDRELRQKIVDQLALDQWLQGYTPKIAVENNVVTLSGAYKSEVQHKRVLGVVNRVASGKKIVDKMELAKP